MKWYVKTECGEVLGPMSEAEAEDMRDRLDDSVMYNERIFEPEFVSTSEVESLSEEIANLLLDLDKMKDGETDGLGELCQAIDGLISLSAKKVVTGSIEGGVLSLDEVPVGVEVEINDYDVAGDEDNLETDESDRSFSPCRWKAE